jgi:tetratricopeptide (TPR) repeat protein
MSNEEETTKEEWKQKLLDPSLVSGFQKDHGISNQEATGLTQRAWRLDGEDGDSFPETGYLELRRQQNTSWANQRLAEGIHFAKQNEHAKAAEAYCKGLELTPNHADLMVAYAALLANQGNREKAIDLLERAIKADSSNANAKAYLAEIRAHGKQHSGILDKSDRAIKDASLEKSFLMGTSATTSTLVADQQNYPLLQEPDEEKAARHRDRRQKRKKDRRKKEKRRKHNRKRKRHDSHSDDDSSSSSEDSQEEKRRRRKRHRKKRRRRHHEDESDGSSTDGTVDSLKIARRHRVDERGDSDRGDT